MKLKGLKIAIILLIILLIAGVGVFAYVFLKTDISLTNKECFYKYLGQEYDVLNNYFIFYKAQEVNEPSYESEINANITAEGNGEELNFGANVNTKKNEEEVFSDISINYEDEEFLNFKYLKEEDKYGIQFPGVKQYVVLENDNLKEFVKKFGLASEEELETIPNKISGILPKELLEFTDEEKEQIKNVVLNAINVNISEERYIKEKSVNIELNKQSVKATGYSVKITEKDILNISKTILEEIKSNEVLLNLIQNKIDYIMYSDEVDIYSYLMRSSFQMTASLLEKANEVSKYNKGQLETIEEEITEESKELTKEKIIEMLEDAIEELQKDIEDANNEDEIKISIYQKDGKTIKIKLEQNTEQESYSYYSYDEEDEEQEEDVSIITNMLELDNLVNEENKSDILITNQSYIDEELQEGQSIQITIENGQEKNSLIQKIEDLTNENVKMSFETVITKDKDNISIATNAETSIEEGSILSDPYTFTTNIEFENNITIGEVSIDESLENNEVILNKLSFEQIDKIVTSIIASVESEIQKTFSDFTFSNPYAVKNNMEETEEQLNNEEESSFEKAEEQNDNNQEENFERLTEMTSNAFNASFKAFERDDLKGININILIKQVETSNDTNDSSKQVILEGAENIENEKTYSVETFDTNDDDYIDKIIVKEI